ncbi:beta-galactosidase [Pararhizobium capsulatum DSM 1112]|uniref:Beta-galactosidase n=1 Tax=Pararhizobium capsulatum DSM 1112 TaxID=1121113 RepID=A0ABU0BUM4_9HYPH|nr:beta-galactosidase [Pararhizobium capsulatum]MDQ0321956.1 beta-galactosidase [Pararhizobium capsulatum DSM 1112]
MTKPSVALSVWRTINTDRFLVGTPHYPEHVDESYWDNDARRMAEAGFNVARLGEFAWHIFEPREGTFDFDLFDRAIEGLGHHGLKTILCAPTATPPRWLTVKHPEILRVDGNGRSMSHGSRQHADTSSPVLRDYSRKITRAMAQHYRENPNVIGWQTDNELNTSMPESYSPSALKEFQAYLQETYKTIDRLNFASGGDFWATAYDDFDQIVFPLDFAPTFPSPGHMQDYHRFLAFSTTRFQHDQVEILRATNSDWFVFHNLGGLRDIDFRGQFSEDLDFVVYDIYPLLYDKFQRIGNHAKIQALHLDICRGFSGNYVVPEQQSGFGAQQGFCTLTPEQGEMRRMAMSSVARGADGVMFFRWRPAHFGAEIYWMGVIYHDDVARHRYDEARRFATEMTALKDKILGTWVHMDVGIAGSDFDNQEAHKTFPIGLPSPQDDAVLLHQYCYDRGKACGFIHPEDDLSRLKVFYVPHWVTWKDGWTERLEAFARNGGTVIIVARTGTRDENNHVIRETAPGSSLSALTGVRVKDFGRLAALGANGLFTTMTRSGGLVIPPVWPAESNRRVRRFTVGNQELDAGYFYENLSINADVEAIGVWSNRYAEGTPVITSRTLGKGRVLYVGTYLTAELTHQLATRTFADADVVPLVPDLPDGVEVTLRESGERRLLFLQNIKDTTATVAGVPSGGNLLDGDKATSGTLTLEGYGCAIIELN